LKYHRFKRLDWIASLGKIDFNTSVWFTVLPLLDPCLMRAAQLLLQIETMLLQKAYDLPVAPIVQSPRHADSLRALESVGQASQVAAFGKFN
jgi:hypothetical protein